MFNKQKVVLKRGQLVTGRNALAKEIGTTSRIVRGRLKLLENEKFMSSKKSNRFTIITICNYDLYQHPKSTAGPAEGPAEGQQNQGNLPKNPEKGPVEGQQGTSTSTGGCGKTESEKTPLKANKGPAEDKKRATYNNDINNNDNNVCQEHTVEDLEEFLKKQHNKPIDTKDVKRLCGDRDIGALMIAIANCYERLSVDKQRICNANPLKWWLTEVALGKAYKDALIKVNEIRRDESRRKDEIKNLLTILTTQDIETDYIPIDNKRIYAKDMSRPEYMRFAVAHLKKNIERFIDELKRLRASGKDIERAIDKSKKHLAEKHGEGFVKKIYEDK
ncbi:MAG: hypothetical protein WBC74_06015 [Candidatus Omnitrophota bacterium]